MDNINVQTYVEPEKTKKSFFGPKIIFLILGIIILVEVVYVVRALTSPTSTPPLPVSNTSNQQSLGKISLITSQASYKIGEEIPVSVMIDTGANAISGVDLIVRFDPQVLTANVDDITKGEILSDYPFIDVDNKTGIVAISGINSIDKTFKGTGQFAVITMKAKKAGNTSVAVDFKRGTTTTSNLVEAKTAGNVLDTVDGVELIIQ